MYLYRSDIYYLLTIVMFVVSLICSGVVRSRFNQYAKCRPRNGMTGAMAAERILRARQTDRGGAHEPRNGLFRLFFHADTVQIRQAQTALAVGITGFGAEQPTAAALKDALAVNLKFGCIQKLYLHKKISLA